MDADVCIDGFVPKSYLPCAVFHRPDRTKLYTKLTQEVLPTNSNSSKFQ